ncbi:MAG TPA: CBM20 domain-containing protein [Candidatus Acidoferrales bacterium]|nr:CBM20 domain-containing protein [Candidatus Acidoferrales bacterium]
MFGLSALTASASIQVTYNVDMSVQTKLGNFNPANGDTVFVSGNFATTNGTWLQTATDGSTNYILTLVPGTTNYTGTFTVTNEVGTFEDHQFVMNPGGNFSGLIWEPNVVGGPNRFFPVPSVNTNLPLVFFNDVSNANQVVVTPVTFSVDMSVQNTIGNFNESAGDIVLVAGDFNGFTANSATLMTDNGHNVWTATCNVTNTVGATENYKFLFIPYSGVPASVWEVDGLGPAGAQNRQFALTALATNIPVAYFNNETNPPSYANVTFNVNMGVQHARGTFTPGTDSISVAGNPLNNWTTGAFILTQSPTNADLYVGTFSVTNVGSTTSFKYVDNNTGIGNGGWETTPNRTTMVPASGTNLPVVFWNNVTNLGNLSLSNNAGTAVLKWTAGTYVGLQSSTSPSGGWGNVPNTQGSNSASISVTGHQFFRLNGP